LKAGGLREQKVPLVEIVEESPPPSQVTVPPAVELEAEPVAEPVPEVEPEPVVEAVTEPVPEPEPEPVKKAGRKPRLKAEPKRETKPKAERKTRTKAKPVVEAEVEPAVEAKVEAKVEPEAEAKLEPEAEPMVEAEAKPEPEVPKVKPDPNAILLTVEEMHSAFKQNSAAAEAKFADKILNVTGVVSIIAVDDTSENPCIILTGADITEMRNVVCSFDKKYGPGLSSLTEGKTVTVQGVYNSRTVNILLMVDCVLVG